MPPAFKLPFPDIRTAAFLRRPNRFVVFCDLPGVGEVRCFLPNPGRLGELLFPDVKVWLAVEPPDTPRKTRYTMIAVERGGLPIFLHTHQNNAVAAHLIQHGLVPGWEDAAILRAEVPHGNSRFDFLVRVHGHDTLVEVKSCTLFGNRVAMFPDAITDRGKRHLEELANLAREGHHAAVLFIVHSHHIDWFMPGYHTDFEFSKTLLRVAPQLPILPISVRWSANLRLANQARRVPIPWDFLQQELVDEGLILVVYQLKKAVRLELPGGITLSLNSGYALSIDNVEAPLTAVANAIDRGGSGPLPPVAAAFRACAKPMQTYPLRGQTITLAKRAHLLRKALEKIADINVPALSGGLWLAHLPRDPRADIQFQDALEAARMQPPPETPL